MFIGSGREKDIAVKRSGKVDRVYYSRSFPLLLTAPEVFVSLAINIRLLTESSKWDLPVS